jgi:hypothetical protein
LVDREVEITEALKHHAAREEQVELKIVAVDSDGKAMSADNFELQGIEIVVD